MTKIFYLVAILIITALYDVQAQTWQTLRIEKQFKIEFPGQFKSKEVLGLRYYLYTDSLGAYMCNFVDMQEKGVSDRTQEQIPSFLDSYIRGIIDAAGEGKILFKRNVTFNGLLGLDVLYHCEAKSNLPSVRYYRVFYFNRHILMMTFWTYPGNEEAALPNKNKFFDSFKLAL